MNKTLKETPFDYSNISFFIDNHDITDIKIFDWDNIKVKKNNYISQSDMIFKNNADYNKFMEGLLKKNHINEPINNLQKFTDDYSFSGLNLVFRLIPGFLTSGKEILCIRKIYRGNKHEQH